MMHLVEFADAVEAHCLQTGLEGDAPLWTRAGLRSLVRLYGWRSYAGIALSPTGRAHAMYAARGRRVADEAVAAGAFALLRALRDQCACIPPRGAYEASVIHLLGPNALAALDHALRGILENRLGGCPDIRRDLAQAADLMGATGALAPFVQSGTMDAMAALHAGFTSEDVRTLGTAGAVTERIHALIGSLAPALACGAGSASRTHVPIASPLLLDYVAEGERARFASLASEWEPDGPALLALLQSSGTLLRIAESVEQQRSLLGDLLDDLGADFEDWLSGIDQLASVLYEVPTPARIRSKRSLEPWRAQVQHGLGLLREDLAPHGAPPPPPRVMWSRHEWVFDAGHGVLFVPDLDNHAARILDAQASLLGVRDPLLVRAWLDRTLLLLLGHEFCHFWRYAAGTSSTDVWFEEWAANRFSVALIKHRHPDVLAGLSEVLAGLDGGAMRGPSQEAKALLAALETNALLPDARRTTYGMDLPDVAFVQLELVRWLLAQSLSFEHEVARCKGERTSAPARLGEAPTWERLIIDVCESAVAETYEDPAWRASIGAAISKGKHTLLDLWLDLGTEIRLPWDVSVLRAAACYLYYCHINLTDDLQDGDCDYLPPRLAPLVCVALTNLSERLRAEASVGDEATRRGASCMARAIAAQHVECTGGIRDADSYLFVGHGIAGEQFASYFLWFLAGTRFASDARRYGFVLGNLAHLQIDILTRDERFLALPDNARRAVIDRTKGDALALINDASAPQSVKSRLQFLLSLLPDEGS